MSAKPRWINHSGLGGDAVGAPPVSRDDMFRTYNDNLRSKNRSEEVEFREAKPFASGCRRTHRAGFSMRRKVPFPLGLTSAMYPSSVRIRASF